MPFTTEKVLYAQDGESDLVTTGAYQRIVLPEFAVSRVILIQVQVASPASYEESEVCSAYFLASTATGPGVLCPASGKVTSLSKEAGNSVGFIKAPAGSKVVLNILS